MIIDGYITREVLKPLFAIGFALVVIFVGYSSGRYLGYAVDGVLQIETLAAFILIKMVIALEVLLPIALYLSIVLALGQLESQHEITAIRASGIGRRRILRVVVLISLLLGAAVACFSIAGRPIAYEQSYLIKAQAEAELEIDKLASGNFYDSEHSERTFFVEEMNKETGTMRGIFIRGESSGQVHIISAESGVQATDETSGRRTLALENAHVYFLGPEGSRDKGIGHFRQLKLWLDTIDPVAVGYKRKAAPIAELFGSDNPLDIAELQWRLSTPVSTLLLALLAVVLSRSAPRIGRYLKTIAALLIYALYYNVAAMAKTWVETGVVAKFPGIWWVHSLLLFVILGLLYLERWRFERNANLSPTLSNGASAAGSA